MPSASNPEIRGFERRLQQGLARTQMAQAQLEDPSAGHPDPDLLAAFAEHTLPKRAQTQVFEHLAICSLCREVVALTAPELEPALVTPASTGKWSRFFSQWSWVPLSACSIGLLVVVGISVMHPHPAKETQQTASMVDKSNQLQSGQLQHAAAKPDNEQTRRQTVTAQLPQNSVPLDLRASRTDELGKVGGNATGSTFGLERQKSELNKKEANAASGVGGAVAADRLEAAGRDVSSLRNMAIDAQRERGATSYSYHGNVAAAPVVATGTAAAPLPPVVQSSASNGTSAQPSSVSAEENVAAFTDLGAGLSRLPHEKDSEKVQAKQVYPPRSSAMTSGYEAEVLDGSAPAAKTAHSNGKRDLSGDQIASAGPQERPTPGLAFATGTPLWTVQSGQLVQSKVQDTEQYTQAAHRSSSAIFEKNVVQLPGNEVALKVAQLGMVLFVVTQNGIMKVSRDNGGVWKDIAGPWQGQVKNVYTIGTLVYAETAANATWTSADQGVTWTQVKPEDVKPQNTKP